MHNPLMLAHCPLDVPQIQLQQLRPKACAQRRHDAAYSLSPCAAVKQATNWRSADLRRLHSGVTVYAPQGIRAQTSLRVHSQCAN